MNKNNVWDKLTRKITLAQLTDDMQMVAAVIGINRTVMLCKELGGLTLHIPTYDNLINGGTRDGQLLQRALTSKEAQDLAQELGNVTIRVPMIKSILWCTLPELVRMEYNGDNIKELAIMYGISQRTAETYIQGRPKPQLPGQIGMFNE